MASECSTLCGRDRSTLHWIIIVKTWQQYSGIQINIALAVTGQYQVFDGSLQRWETFTTRMESEVPRRNWTNVPIIILYIYLVHRHLWLIFWSYRYYINHETKTTTWEDPRQAIRVPEARVKQDRSHKHRPSDYNKNYSAPLAQRTICSTWRTICLT